MGDVRDSERDQPLPVPGNIPVQEVMIRAIRERREYGKRKYGRALETHNGRDALKDAWEEAIDLFTYLTQMRLERGDQIEGMDSESQRYGASADLFIEDEAIAFEPHAIPDGALAAAVLSICPECRHDPHAPGRCRSQALNLGCGCLCR